MSERLGELYALTQKAQKMEMINEEVALEIYNEIFENYIPKISKTYESAIRLLEKRHRYDEALKISNMAIRLIKEDQISGTLERFEAISLRLNRKIEESTPVEPEPEKRSTKLSTKHLAFAGIVLLLAFFLFKTANPYDDLNVNLEGKQAIEGSDQVFDTSKEGINTPDESTYPITESMISIAVAEIKKDHEVVDASIIPQEGTIGFAVLVRPSTSSERCEAIATQLVKTLSGAASAEYSDLNGPGPSSLGDIYNYYELVISVGTGTSEEEIISKGTKNKDSANIYWRQ